MQHLMRWREQAVNHAIEAGLPSVMREFGSSVLQPLEGLMADFDSTIVSESQHACLNRMWAPDGAVTHPSELTLLYRAHA